jgi:lysyl-tRNA synthetase class 2
MESRDFLEVETPIIQTMPGGASAKPFVTHYNTFGINAYLRISPELHLKRLVIAGFNRIFEINRSFRNEGVSSYHNPEFTMMELYMAYMDHRDLMELTETLLCMLAEEILGSKEVPYGKLLFDFGKPFRKLSMKDAILNFLPEVNIEDFNQARKFATSIGIRTEKEWGLGRLIFEIFEEVVEKKLLEPTFITEYPTEVSPLARRNSHNPEITDRFELFIGGREIGNGFSELNDSEDQANRFISQAKEGHLSDTVSYDSEYVEALEYGLPPTAGLGIGIDRLVMLLTDSSTIRDVILFPTLRP